MAVTECPVKTEYSEEQHADGKLPFQPVRVGDYDRIYRYTSVYGERSCQYSPVSMFSLREKYGDSYCEQDGFLFVLRKNLSDDYIRVYLAPIGEGDWRKAFETIAADAAAYGARMCFMALTEKLAAQLEEVFPGRFLLREDRNMAEYIYDSRIMGAFEGSELRKRRAEVRTFWNTFGDRARVEPIVPDMFPAIMQFEKEWVTANKETHDMDALERDIRSVDLQLEHFEELRLYGIVLLLDERIVGMAYGVNLGDTYDVIVEKADRSVPHVYKVLRSESAKRVAEECPWTNMEEDVGVPGLRALKLAYKPAYLLCKSVATEV